MASGVEGCGGVSREESVSRRRVWSIVSKTDDMSSPTGFVWPLDLVGEKLKKNNSNKRGRLLLTLTREMSAGGGNKSQAGKT